MNDNPHLRHSSAKGLLWALAATAVFSTNWITVKYALRAFNSDTISFIWLAAAAVYSLAIILATKQTRQLAFGRREVGSIAVLGISSAGAMLLAWAGVARLDPSFASFLFRFAPVLIIITGAVVLRERLMKKELLPMALMVLGGFLGAAGAWKVVGVGAVLILLSCFCVAVQLLTAKKTVARLHPNILVFYRTAAGTVAVALWVFTFGKVEFDAALSYWLVALLGALLGPCVGHLLMYRSYRCWDMSRTALVATLEPLLVLPMAWLFLSRLPNKQELYGGCVILAGAFWLAWIHLRKKPAGLSDEAGEACKGK
ncbi:MAG: DMT family transporter [Phycisphaerae bacterium]|jgi:drug/metabolite transporter (DMT)-like permease|nr:DMT family transporter [Phycisphaerae bacterium]